MCQKLRSLEIYGKPLSAHLLVPLLKSEVGSFLKVFKYECYSAGALEDLLVILPLLQSIEELSVEFFAYETSGVNEGLLFQSIFRSQWPKTIRVLHLTMDSSQGVTYVAELARLLDGKLSLLRELHLSMMRAGDPGEIQSLGRVLTRMPKLQTLVIKSPRTLSSDYQCHVIDCLLGLNLEDPSNQNFPQLRTLLLGGTIDWTGLGRKLSEGRFPLLVELRQLIGIIDEGPGWFERGIGTTDLWFKLIVSRNLKAFDHALTWCNARCNAVMNRVDLPPELMTRYLLGISKLDVKFTSCLASVGFSNVTLNDDNCSALTKAIGSGALPSIESVGFNLDLPACTPRTLASLGAVMNNRSLPLLNSLTIGGRGDDLSPSALKWRAFVGGIPLSGLDALKYLTLTSFPVGGSSLWPILQAMAFPGKPITLPKLARLEIDVDIVCHKGLSALSAALMSGMCTNVEYLEFYGKGKDTY